MVNKNLPKQIKNRELNGGTINYNTNPIEKCVICEQVTQYFKNTNIQTRDYYVQGCGQLCSSCYFYCYNLPTTNQF